MSSRTNELNWRGIIVLTISPLIGIGLLPVYLYYTEFNPWYLLFTLVFFVLAGMSITVGYHRLISHKSFETHPLVKAWLLFWGASAIQNSALRWCSDHRRHHKYIDNEADPYSITEGFWHAHISWVFFKEKPEYQNHLEPDLLKDKMVVWQDKHYTALAFFSGLILPTLIGWAIGNFMGGLIFTMLKITLVHHSTFFVNSICHYWGSKPYNDKNTARDNWFVAFLTYGEGYHNFHHKFEADYRNGIRWYQFDPSKWMIEILAYLGLAKNLRQVSEEAILKARLRQQERKMLETWSFDEEAKKAMQALRYRVEESQVRWKQLKRDYRAKKKDLASQGQAKVEEMRESISNAKKEFAQAKAQWKSYCRTVAASPA